MIGEDVNWANWTTRFSTFGKLARDITRKLSEDETEPSNHDYQLAIEVLKKMHLGFSYQPKPVGNMCSANICVLGIFFEGSLYDFLTVEGATTSEKYSSYMKSVISTLEEPYRATSEGKERASRVLGYLARLSEREAKKIYPDGNI